MDPDEELPAVLITPFQPVPDPARNEGNENPPVQVNRPVANLAAPAQEIPPQAAQASQQHKPNRKIFYGSLTACLACSCAGIPIILLLILAAVISADPFNLHLWGRLNGRYDAAAEVMPENTSIYVGANIGNALLTRVDRVLAPMMEADPTHQTFLPGSLHANLAPIDEPHLGIIDDMVQQIYSETGVKIPEDLTPWIGQYAGLGVIDSHPSSYRAPLPKVFLLAIEARNIKRADAFLETLQGNLSLLKSMKFSQESFNGSKLYIGTNPDGYVAVAFGRSGRMVLIATELYTLKDAINRRGELSLTKKPGYSNLTSQRSRNWSLSMFYNAEMYGNSMMESSQSGATAFFLYNMLANKSWTAMLIEASVFKNGLRIDSYAAFDIPSNSTSGNQSLIEYQSVDEVDHLLPQDTVLYFALPHFNDYWQSLSTALLPRYADMNEIYDEFEAYFGFSLEDDLINHLDGQSVVYVVPSTKGLLPHISQTTNLAVSLIAETDDNLDLDLISTGIARASQATGINIDQEQQAGITYYKLGGDWDEGPMLAFGQSNGYFAFGTDMDVLESTFVNNTPLVNTENYQQVILLLPAGMQPYGYVDLGHLFGSLREGMDSSEIHTFNDSIGILDHIDSIVMAGQLIQPNISHASVIVLLTGQ